MRKEKSTAPSKHLIEALKQPSVTQKYRAKLDEHLSQLNTASMSADDHWNHLSAALNNVAASVLGSPPPRQRKPWFDIECEKAIETKLEARARWLKASTRAISKKADRIFSEERKVFSVAKRKSMRNGIPKTRGSFTAESTIPATLESKLHSHAEIKPTISFSVLK